MTAEPAAGPLSRLIAAAWTEVLDVGEVGLDDDFFALGGNSLHAVRIVARLEEDLDVDLSVRDVLETRSVREMSGRLGSILGRGEP
jgi:acyl carrier protein